MTVSSGNLTSLINIKESFFHCICSTTSCIANKESKNYGSNVANDTWLCVLHNFNGHYIFTFKYKIWPYVIFHIQKPSLRGNTTENYASSTYALLLVMRVLNQKCVLPKS